MPEKKPLEIILASPRGFCAGVDRAIKIVERALDQWGPPVYVRHEIVHNRRVIETLKGKGVVFVESLDQCPGDRPVIFSAHGVPKSVISEAKRRNLHFIDAVCPLVSKVHNEAIWNSRNGRQVIMVGHKGHQETIGTMGQVPGDDFLLVEDAADVDRLEPRDENNLSFVTQTTLSVDDTAETIEALRRRFPNIVGPKVEDICYAASNRQAAVKAISDRIDALIVAGAPNSSNSKRLVEVVRKMGVANAQLVQGCDEINWRQLGGVAVLGVTSGASAPEDLVQEIMHELCRRFDTTIEEFTFKDENVSFNLPRSLQ
ncbi:MAG: 4-hydroxy-3-methylbut-2-enyl diphosphate reductase [Rhodobacteraceae bacterium]|nr:4-hydroxy-3-methylbut-2-enyl diphosphate reductase [Paracoccaceae bacterium]